MSRDPFGDTARRRLAEKCGRVPSGAPEPTEPPAADSGEQQGAPEGFGGGVQSVTVPEGESFGDAVRRAVLGG
jgi:hypothetical protein